METGNTEKLKTNEKLNRFIRTRWFPLIAVSSGVGLIIVGMILCGWRFVYAPELNNNWDAISGVAAWVGILVSIASVGASLGAVWAAIQVPNKIAKKQDAISLFEKRFDCYNTIQNLLVCASQIEEAKTNKDVQVAFRIYFGQPEDIVKNESGTIFALQLKQKQPIIVSGAFLFSEYNVKMLQKIIDTGVSLIMCVATNKVNTPGLPLSAKATELKEEYCQLCREFEEQYIESMEKELELNKIK